MTASVKLAAFALALAAIFATSFGVGTRFEVDDHPMPADMEHAP